MNIRPLKVTVREVVTGYVDDSDREEGIYGYGGLLNIRPKYQRNYIYDDAKRNAVIDTVCNSLISMFLNEELLEGKQFAMGCCLVAAALVVGIPCWVAMARLNKKYG